MSLLLLAAVVVYCSNNNVYKLVRTTVGCTMEYIFIFPLQDYYYSDRRDFHLNTTLMQYLNNVAVR
jgi:hypothetical protein